MNENFTLTPENTYLLNNENVEKFMNKFKISYWIGKDKNEYSLTIITDKVLAWTWIFKLEQIKWKITKYLIYKYPPNWFEAKNLSSDEALNMLNLDHKKGEMSIWLDIETWKFYVDVIDKWMHTAVFWVTNSWKTVTLKWLLYQIAKYKYSEFILLGKDDFLALENVKKVKYISDVATMNKAEFNAFISYIWLNVADRWNKLKRLWYAWKYEEYKYNVMLKDPNAEQIPHLIIFMDEFETLRESVSAELAGWTEEFDTKLKTIANYVRSFWILLYFGSQNYLKQAIWIMRDYTWNQLIWYSKNVQAWFIDTDKANLTNAIQKTYLFYSVQKNAFLKIPFDAPIEIDNKIRKASEENLLFDESYYKRLNHTYELVNDLIFKVDSDIFKIIKKIYKYFKLDNYYDKLLKTAEFVPLSILLYSIFFNLEPENNIGPNIEIYPKSTFKKKIDQQLFDDNKTFYEKSSFLAGIKNIYKEGAQDKEAFIEAINEAMSSYIKTITWNTDLSYLFPEDENNDSDIEQTEINNWNNNEHPGSVLEQLKKNEEEDKKKEEEKHLLIKTIHTGEIKPASFNGMYFVKKDKGDFWISQEARNYEKDIKTKLLNKMIAKQIKQVTWPVIIDIEFTLWLKTKKDWFLTRVGRNDLDNLLKATIDGIKWTIIQDDKQVFGIRTKINYIEKHSSINKNNKVEIKVFDFNKDTILKYKNKFIWETEVTPLYDIKIDKNSKIIIPTVNKMYFVNTKGKKQLSSSALNYKYFLREQINWLNQQNNVEKTKEDILLYLEFFLPKDSLIERDLDNMLKATIDSFKDTFIYDDDQIREIVCFKSLLKDTQNYKNSLKIKAWKYNLWKEIKKEEKWIDLYSKIDDIFETDNNHWNNNSNKIEDNIIMPKSTNIIENNNINKNHEIENIEIEDIELDDITNNSIENINDNIKELDINDEISIASEEFENLKQKEENTENIQKPEEFININDNDNWKGIEKKEINLDVDEDIDLIINDTQKDDLNIIEDETIDISDVYKEKKVELDDEDDLFDFIKK